MAQGRKTHEQQMRILERKADLPDARRLDDALPRAGRSGGRAIRRDARQSEFPVSRGGMNQEDRSHNKHNHSGQPGHKPQQHSPAEEKKD
jgi:hypothetical protein